LKLDLTFHQTIYIFLGVAAVIGLVAGSILHISSTVLISLFDLTPEPDERGWSIASVRAGKEKRKLEDASQSSSSRGETRSRSDSATDKKYAEWLEKDRGRRKEEGLFRQTILEEDDDSEVGF
jgi:hypothetical protein